MKAVVAENLAKTYPSGKKALDGISLSIDEGEVFGFLGPNGAGKTTTVKLLNGMLLPTGGVCSVFDHDPGAVPEKVHQASGVVTEHAQMYNNLTGLQNLIFYAAAFGMDANMGKKRARAMLERLGLEDAADSKLSGYSTGMRQRLSLARAMLHSPKILFLDEPTAGLDPESAHSVHNLIRDLAYEQGTTVFLCTHQLRYAQEVCTHYGLIDEGQILACGTLEELRKQVSTGLTLKIQSDRYPEGVKVDERGEYGEIALHSREEIPAVVRQIVESGGQVYHVSAEQPSLEQIYFTLIERREGTAKEEGSSW